jgi:hypothetical protein
MVSRFRAVPLAGLAVTRGSRERGGGIVRIGTVQDRVTPTVAILKGN